MGADRPTGQGRAGQAIGWQRPSLVLAILTLVALSATVLAATPPRSVNPGPFDSTSPPMATSVPHGRWAMQTTGVSAILDDVSCADGSHCIAVGAAGVILSTSDAGTTWSSRDSGTTHPLVGVSCPTPAVCYAVSNFGDLLKTGDAGLTWSISVLRGRTPFAISCPTTVDCVTADGFQTHDGGDSWQQASRLGGVNLACPASSRCYAVRNQLGHGAILGSSGAGWTLQTVTPYFLNAVICTSVTTCVAVGGGESGSNILTTGDGHNWTVQQHQATEQTLFDVGCATVDVCFVLDGTANVLTTTNRGQTWAWQSTGLVGSLYAISCPARDSCFVVGSGTAPTGGGLVAHYQSEMTR
ncbi:MAG: hypothetical protein E6I99_14190 [Chloroflexi bacterium]|nr:MAG: hypothetical protein E6I99_14190 [Chloroflexota bacterium]